jgi:2-methylisocitrate lyase-like PEP mutase family enzyme
LSIDLKTRLAKSPAVLAPGVYDALTALLVEQAGFEAAYISGASIAYTQLGRPDLGLVGLDQLVDVVARVRERVELPLIVDADTGFGNAINAQRLTRLLERAGASAIQFEDQTFPKRCGHLAGKTLIPTAEMAGKLRAAADARSCDQTLIVGRTDAIAVEGFDAALERAEAYLAAGADILFVEAPRTTEQMRELNARFAERVPLLANMVEGGDTPILPCAELSRIGYRLVIAPGALVRAAIPVMEDFLASLKAYGSSRAYTGRMIDLQGVNRRVGLNSLIDQGRHYDRDLNQAE